MSSGQNAAESTKSVFSQGAQATEDLRKNVNSFADNLLTDNKTVGSGDVHPDAKKTGEEARKGVETAEKKMEETAQKHKSK